MKKKFFIYILAALLVVYFAWMFISQQIEIKERTDEINVLQEEIDNVKKESERLREEIVNAESRETIESIAREELGLIYPDERKFVDSNG